jgi:hypothetical protein
MKSSAGWGNRISAYCLGNETGVGTRFHRYGNSVRDTRIELVPTAWEAVILPLN